MMAFQSNESGRHEVYNQPFRGDGERSRISTNGGVQARWRADGRQLFYLTLEGQLMAVSIAPVDHGRAVMLSHRFRCFGHNSERCRESRCTATR